MKTGLHNTLILAGIAAGLYCQAGSAQGIQFFDGGYPELCEVAAKNNNVMSGARDDVEITGSRLGVEPIEICTLAIRTAENNINRAASYNNRGVLLFAKGSITEALSDFEKAISEQETLAQAYVNRAYTLMALMRWADAITAFDTGIALGTADAPAKVHFNRGVAHEELGHVREAYRDYVTASELDPLWEQPKQELMRFTVTRRSTGG